ncbi:hypothetical protein AUP68_10926 [Ilyonectria robusta]
MSYLEMNWATEDQLVWVRDAKMGLSDYLDRWYNCSWPTAADEQQKANVETATSSCVPRKTHEDRRAIESSRILDAGGFLGSHGVSSSTGRITRRSRTTPYLIWNLSRQDRIHYSRDGGSESPHKGGTPLSVGG